MDLVETLRRKIDVLEDGEYVPGLKAVLLHIETAFRHLSRGQDNADDTAFTDAIYRTNQAFEGSIKEAYRVLAGQDPARKRPFDIENYLEQNNVFRARVLSQLTNYRTEWRNPSAHDYKLDFDENEAFLAIVSVSAFSCLLLDQIAERLSFVRAQAEAEAQQAVLKTKLEGSQRGDLLDRAVALLDQFCALHVPASDGAPRESESQLIGALHGFLASAAPDLQVRTEVRLDQQRPFRADVLISNGDEHVVVELKRSYSRKNYQNAVAQVEHYLLVGGMSRGILLFLPDGPGAMEKNETSVRSINGRVIVMKPAGAL